MLNCDQFHKIPPMIQDIKGGKIDGDSQRHAQTTWLPTAYSILTELFEK